METSLPIAKINGDIVHGQAHCQPGINKWIGVCIVSNDFLGGQPEDLSSVIIEYEGPFNCRKFQTTGKGKAKVLCVSKMPKKNQLIVTFEGIGEPDLERKLKQKIKHSYNENLPVYINKNMRRKDIKRT